MSSDHLLPSGQGCEFCSDRTDRFHTMMAQGLCDEAPIGQASFISVSVFMNRLMILTAINHLLPNKRDVFPPLAIKPCQHISFLPLAFIGFLNSSVGQFESFKCYCNPT